jgi:hypothetical protein
MAMPQGNFTPKMRVVKRLFKADNFRKSPLKKHIIKQPEKKTDSSEDIQSS